MAYYPGKIYALTVLAVVWAFSPAAEAQYNEYRKLVAQDPIGSAQQGWSVALSNDGKTGIVGGPVDNTFKGAVWVWTNDGGQWVRTAKLIAADAVGNSEQGYSVAVSADGNTVLVGGPFDISNASRAGAAWVFTRNGVGVWDAGTKLVGSGAVDSPIGAQQGWSVALSADGNTALVGGDEDNGGVGAVWVWVRSGGAWSQQGNKLVAPDAMGAASQGQSVALSADGNTALVGGDADNANAGAVWVWVRNGGFWSRQAKLVGSGPIGSVVAQGFSVELSADGNTALWGGLQDNGGVGAAWVFTRTGTAWSQQGAKLVSTGAGGNANQGASVALSGDGNTALIGGPTDNGQTGAVWVWVRTGGIWSQQGTKLVGSGAVGNAEQGFSVAISADAQWFFEGGPYDNNNIGAVWVFNKAAALFVRVATNLPSGDSILNLTNMGAYKAGLGGGTSASVTGAICANVYAFTPDEQMVSCCSCPVTPDGLVSLSAKSDLASNTLTPAIPTALVITLLATAPVAGSCNNSAASVTPATLVPGMLAWDTTIHATPTAGVYGVTETPFSPATLGADELGRLGNLCNFIIANGSGFGQCKSCHLGGLGAAAGQYN